jgi:hypothetical protein
MDARAWASEFGHFVSLSRGTLLPSFGKGIRDAECGSRAGGGNDDPDLDVRVRVRGPDSYACKNHSPAATSFILAPSRKCL